MLGRTMIVTRFAPSPTGHLHLGHAHSALVAADEAARAGGVFLLRIEDIDGTRCRPEYVDGIERDLAWLGLDWPRPVHHQSRHMDDYRAALDRLAGQGLVYPCFCTRQQIAAEIAASGNAPHGPDGPVYPGTCRHLDPAAGAARIAAGETHAFRLDVAAARARAGRDLTWTDRAAGVQQAQPELFGDVVLARKETPTSYHLAVTVDDALQGVTLVTRGIDLFAATHVHRLLQALLDLPVPQYRHHRLLTDEHGRRYAKRDRSLTLASLRDAGHGPAEVRALAGFPQK